MKSKAAIEALGALAQESRLAIFRLLVREGPDGLSAGAIAGRLGVPAPTLSFHLAYLKRAGLIDQTREGRTLLYAANTRGMRSLLAYLTEDCCGGRPEICGLAACGPAAATNNPRSRRLRRAGGGGDTG
jgi:DNA-binding transcriptional ArsR family regulator